MISKCKSTPCVTVMCMISCIKYREKRNCSLALMHQQCPEWSSKQRSSSKCALANSKHMLCLSHNSFISHLFKFSSCQHNGNIDKHMAHRFFIYQPEDLHQRYQRAVIFLDITRIPTYNICELWCTYTSIFCKFLKFSVNNKGFCRRKANCYRTSMSSPSLSWKEKFLPVLQSLYSTHY